MAKAPRKQIAIKRVTASLAYLRERDTGHKFSDNKYKVTLVGTDGEDSGDAIKVTVDEFIEDLFEKCKDPKNFSDKSEVWPEEVSFDEVKLPYRTAEDMSDKVIEAIGDDKITLLAKTKDAPSLVDAKRKKLPRKVTPMGGDLVTAVVTIAPYKTTEKVKEGKKMVDVPVYGFTSYLNTVQLIEKRGGGGGMDLLDEEEGYEADTDDDEDDVDDEDGDEDNDGDY
jgi:hypothetical protein